MTGNTVAILGFVSLFVLMLLRVPVGMAMGLVGVSGFAYLVNGDAALKIIGHTSMRTVTDYTFGVIPMFLLMGAFVTNSGMSRELFRAANTFLGHRRGGLGIATIAAAVGAGGLGELIFRGVASIDNRLVLAGAIPAALLALSADAALGLLERHFKVPGK